MPINLQELHVHEFSFRSCYLWVAMAPPGAKNRGSAPRVSATPEYAAIAPRPGRERGSTYCTRDWNVIPRFSGKWGLVNSLYKIYAVLRILYRKEKLNIFFIANYYYLFNTQFGTKTMLFKRRYLRYTFTKRGNGTWILKLRYVKF